MLFSIRRLWLLVKGALVDRDRPRLDRLSSLDDPERFVWEILPHAARSFAPSILLLPEAEARTCAVAYLYARMLDTYEDLSTSPESARALITGFANRFHGEILTPAPIPTDPGVVDVRDRAHLLLIARHHLVDSIFQTLDPSARDRIARLIAEMAAGMIEFSEVFEQQGGVLETDDQVLAYCRRVIGLPALFTLETILGADSHGHADDALAVSELIQLANITRDIEKDLARGVAYHPGLRPYLMTDGAGEASDAVAAARRHLMVLARSRAPSFRRLLQAVELPRLSTARAAAVMMMLFTDNHYRKCAVAAGLPSWSGPKRVPTMALTAFPATMSPWWADRVLLRVERDLLATT